MGEFNYRMKKIISVKEFKDYCEKNKPHSIIYQTENQKWYRVSDPCKVRMSFKIMLIYENPNLICLKSGTNTISFDMVKYIEIDTESTVLGTLITVFCGKFGTSGHDIAYTLIAT